MVMAIAVDMDIYNDELLQKIIWKNSIFLPYNLKLSKIKETSIILNVKKKKNLKKLSEQLICDPKGKIYFLIHMM